MEEFSSRRWCARAAQCGDYGDFEVPSGKRLVVVVVLVVFVLECEFFILTMPPSPIRDKFMRT